MVRKKNINQQAALGLTMQLSWSWQTKDRDIFEIRQRRPWARCNIGWFPGSIGHSFHSDTMCCRHHKSNSSLGEVLVVAQAHKKSRHSQVLLNSTHPMKSLAFCRGRTAGAVMVGSAGTACPRASIAQAVAERRAMGSRPVMVVYD